ncbi:universal stress protein [candidate division FCPU426 bacterium]|nr:universal stress protein [candidate division FCPU426 bacterium]
MKHFKKILCLYTRKEDQSALEQSMILAEANQAELTLVSVVEELPAECKMENAREWQKIGDRQRKACGHFLEKITAVASNKGVKTKVKVLDGIPAIRVIQEVLKHQYDLVVASAMAQRGLHTLLWGSTVHKLIRKAPVPVWVIKSTQHKPFRRVLAAVDPDPTNGVKTGLNRKIIEWGIYLAERGQGKLTIVHAWTPKTEFLITMGHTPINQQDRTALAKAIQLDRKNALDQLVEPYRRQTRKLSVELVAGRPGYKIAETAQELKSDLVIMGTLNRTGIVGLLIGSTIEETLERLECSLLAVKPDGFKTPVTLG